MTTPRKPRELVPLCRLYKFMLSAGELGRLELACWLISKPELFSEWSRRSLDFYARFSNASQLFHDPRKRDLPYRDTILDIRRGDDLVVLLADRPSERSWWEVDGCPDMTFGYIDYEVAPLRDARPDRVLLECSGMRSDLLLVGHDGTPIVGEVKVATEKSYDADPVLALVQGLTLCAQLRSPQQMERLEFAYSGRFKAIGQIDLYVFLVKPQELAKSTYQADLYKAAKDLGDVIASAPSSPARRIDFIEVRFDGVLDLRNAKAQ